MKTHSTRTKGRATPAQCRSCTPGKGETPRLEANLRVELGELTLQRSAIGRRMDAIKATLENCAACGSNTSLIEFIRLRDSGLTSVEAGLRANLKASSLRKEMNERFVLLSRRLQEPWAQKLPQNNRVSLILRDQGLATLKLSLLSETEFRKVVAEIATEQT